MTQSGHLDIRPMSKTKVYYNSACPVCNAGIKFQQRQLADCKTEIEWIDVHSFNEAAGDVNSNLRRSQNCGAKRQGKGRSQD